MDGSLHSHLSLFSFASFFAIIHPENPCILNGDSSCGEYESEARIWNLKGAQNLWGDKRRGLDYLSNDGNLKSSENNSEKKTQSADTYGEWNKWADFSPCSATCGHAVRVRYRKCVPPDHECIGDLHQEEPCDFVTCPNDKTDKVKRKDVRNDKDDRDESPGREPDDDAETVETDDHAGDKFNTDGISMDDDDTAHMNDDDDVDFSANEEPEVEETLESERRENVGSKPDNDDEDKRGDQQADDDGEDDVHGGTDGDDGADSHAENDHPGMDDETGDDNNNADSAYEGDSAAESDAMNKKKKQPNEDDDDQEEEDKDEEEEKDKKKKRRRRRRKKTKKKKADEESTSSESSYDSSTDESTDSESHSFLGYSRPKRLDIKVRTLPSTSSYGAAASPNADIDDDILESDYNARQQASPDFPSPLSDVNGSRSPFSAVESNSSKTMGENITTLDKAPTQDLPS